MSASAQATVEAGPGGLGHAYSGVVRAQLEDLQRARMIDAARQLCGEHGADSITVADIVERSGISRRTFYEQFSDREDCLLAAFEQALSLACARVVPAFEAEGGWRERVRAGLTALLALFDEEPAVGRLLVVDAPGCGTRTMTRQTEVLALLTRVIDGARAEAKGDGLSPLTAEGVLGGVFSVVQARLRAKGDVPLVGLTSELMSMIAMPYFGAAAARRELDRRVSIPSGPRGEAPVVAEPFKGLGLRLTYRTVCVLLSAAEHPNGSNREIGRTAGMSDQGQISKLLARLQRAGLLTNCGLSPGKGAPNAWALTSNGEQVVSAIRTYSEAPAGVVQ